MQLTVIGAGYVGLVAGTCFADAGHEVTCVDADRARVETLAKGQVPFFEPGLAELVARNVREGRLSFSTELRVAPVTFIAVGTPEGSQGDANVDAVLAAATAIGDALTGPTIVVDKSTVPVGTAERVRQTIASRTTQPFEVLSNPEFLREGAAVDDFLNPDRVIVGGGSERARGVLSELYAPFVRTERPVVFMDLRSAELTKYAANAMLATRISFMNDMAALCDALGADVDLVRKGIGADHRIGYPYLFAGVGYGGSCFTKDLHALLAMGRPHGVELELLRAVDRTNERQKQLLVTKAERHFGGSLRGMTFAVWGLSFKPKTDDLRDAPSLELIAGLLSRGAKVQVFDPVAMDAARRVLGNRVQFAAQPYDALDGVDALFLVTEWNEFRRPDFDKMRARMRQPVIFDGRNVFPGERLRAVGFHYEGVGLGAS